MFIDPESVEGIVRNGTVELLETPVDVVEARVIVTFLPENAINLCERDIDEAQAAGLRGRLRAFAEDWELPEMGVYGA